MHVFLYEWATGGGLVEEPGRLPASLVREGSAMVSALAADLVRVPDCRVTVLRDMRVLDLCVPGCQAVDVLSRAEHWEHFAALASSADATLVIAPEFDGILLRSAREVVRNQGRLVSASPELIRVAADKQRTAELLAAAGVPVPDAVVLEPEESLPKDFTYPAVLKPIDGAGSQDVQLVTGPHDDPLPYHRSRRLERYYPGMSASVAALSGPQERAILTPCRQLISDDGRLQYLGGALPLMPGLAERAVELAKQTLSALPPATGFLGIDLVLGHDPDGCLDVVIEVNPRPTTSYVGLRAAVQPNLAAALLDVALGRTSSFELSSRGLEFDTAGNVSLTTQSSPHR